MFRRRMPDIKMTAQVLALYLRGCLHLHLCSSVRGMPDGSTTDSAVVVVCC